MKKWTGISLAVAVAAAIIASAGSASASNSHAASVAPVADNIAAPAAINPDLGVVPALATTPTVSPETLFVPIAPCRIIDTRSGGGKIPSGSTRNFVVSGMTGFGGQGGTAGGCGIPTDAIAFAGSVTANNPMGPGYLRAFPYNTTEPNGGTIINYSHKVGNLTTGVTQSITPNATYNWSVHNYGPAIDLAVDVSGYYVPQIEAQVGADGTISSGTSRVLDVVHAGTGFYYVDIDRNARSCSIQATAYNIYRMASSGYSSTATPNRISVYIFYMNGSTPTPVDYPFHVLVTC